MKCAWIILDLVLGKLSPQNQCLVPKKRDCCFGPCLPPHLNKGKSSSCSLMIYFKPNQLAATTVLCQSAQPPSRVRLCDPVDCSTPGLPVHHQLPEPCHFSVISSYRAQV